MPNSKMYQAALDWANAGFYIFPCKVGRKEPACDHGILDATRDIARINAWWTENPDYNVGCAPHMSGHCVLDADPPLGLTTLSELQEANGALPTTLTITTPRGGLHLWFEGELPSGANKLGPKIDTRGIGGYVLAPPSTIAPGEYDNNPNGGSYAIRNSTDIAPAPTWVANKLAASRTTQLAAPGDLDTPENVGRVKSALSDLVSRGDVAIEGSGGNDRTFRLFGKVLDLGVSHNTALELVAEIWNPHCRPPWSDDELETICDNAARYRQNEIGCYAVGDAVTLYDHVRAEVSRSTPGDGEGAENHPYFYALNLKEQSEVKEPEWIVPDLIPEKGQILVFGKQKSFKSFLVADLALGVAAGQETFGYRPAQRSVVYAVGEGQANLTRKHIPAWRIARCRDDEFPFYVIPHVPLAIDTNRRSVRAFIDQIKKQGIDPGIVVIDTMSKSIIGLEENSAKDVNIFAGHCDQIREELGCAVVVVHHSGKDIGRGSRGSNALEGAFDTVLEVRRHEKSMFATLNVRDQRAAQEREEPYYFQGHKIGSSLAFQPISAATYMAGIEGDNPLTSTNTGAALGALNAYGYENGVTTFALAYQLTTGEENHEAKAKALATALEKEMGRNEGLRMQTSGDPLRWHLLPKF